MQELLALMTIIISIVWSLWMRIIRWRGLQKQSIEKKAIQTPLSVAVQELAGTAGGVYLSLIMLISFLRLDIIEKISFWGINCDPVAFTSMSLAIIQPLLLKIINKE